MQGNDSFGQYVREVGNKYQATDSNRGSEMNYRTQFEKLLEDIFNVDGKVQSINHDSTNDKGNKPDFVISSNDVPLLYIEAKDIGVDLDKVEKTNQLERYFGYNNLILTDYLEFRFFRNGVKYGEGIRIAELNKGSQTITPLPQNFELLRRTITDFCYSHKEPIKSGLHLAKIMGGKAQRIRDNLKAMIENSWHGSEELIKMRDVIKENLVSSITDDDFADMYAQTLVYGLFAARYDDETPDSFSRIEARDLVPKTNPFLRSFFDHIAGNTFPKTLGFIVDELCEIFTHANINNLLVDFYKQQKDDKDPIIHFYEDFLKEYDSTKKMEMGVFYTPKQVVQFIVRSVDEALKLHFDIPKGLSDNSKVRITLSEEQARGDEGVKSNQVSARKREFYKEYHKVQVLDIATGTGTFLNETVNLIHSTFRGQEGRWPSYVQEHLLPRVHGFELMMASYTIAHLKLGMTLHDSGSTDQQERLGIYLTNTLDEPIDREVGGTLFGFMDSITEESRLASKVKTEYPIMCVIGNPPYSGISQNNQYTDNEVYKVEPGGTQKLQERKHWLNDDYVKFIRYGESLVEKNKEGILGMITAHGYIDNPTFRGMRWHLRKTFDVIYVVDLHGNSNKKETAPDGSKDENVFDIKTGVAIIIGVKNNTKAEGQLAQVKKLDVYGLRKNKFETLEELTLGSGDWVGIPLDNEVWGLKSLNTKEYDEGFSVNDLFNLKGVGVVTARDKFVISDNKTKLQQKMANFINMGIEEARSNFDLRKDVQSWKVKWAQEEVIKTGADDSNFVQIS